jgi:hypothetical protein
MDIVVTIEGPPPRVDPGGEISATVRVRNAGDIVDEFYVTVVGDPERWTVVEPTSISLFPGTEGTVQLRFRPPRASSTPAGRLTFGVAATSRVDPEKAVVEEGVIDVLSYHEATAELVPKTSRAWRSTAHVLRLANLGNEAITGAVAATDADQRLELAVTPATLQIEPGASREATVSVGSRSAPLFGSTERLPFAVSVNMGASRAPIVTDGVFEQRPPLGRSPLPLLAFGTVLIVGALLLTGVIKVPGSDGTTTVTDPPESAAVTDTPASSSPTPVSQTATPEAPVVCGALSTPDVFFNLGSGEPTVVVDRRACLFQFVMFSPGSGSGPVSLQVDGVDFFRFEMAAYDSVGVEGGGSGERMVELNPTVPVRPGQTISLDESGCIGDGCGQFSFSISAANAP